MKTGTKSILFGAHCFFIHPVFVFIAWWKLYGFPFDPRLWIAFVVHDLGYLGKTNMDDEEGEKHVELGAKIMLIFGKKWSDFTKYHSRFYAGKDNAKISRLCIADKFSITLEPSWLYLIRANSSGEIHEYMKIAKDVNGKYKAENIETASQKKWLFSVQVYLRKWVEENKNI